MEMYIDIKNRVEDHERLYKMDNDIFKKDDYNNLDNNMIYDNIDKTDKEERIRMLRDIFTDKKINNELLRYELYYDNRIIEFKSEIEKIEYIEKILNKFRVLKKTKLEDDEWILHKKGSKKYSINDNEYIYENSIMINDINDDRTREYIESIIEYCKRTIKDIRIRYKYIVDVRDENIYWIIVIIKC